MAKKSKNFRDLNAINAHFRRSGPMQDRRYKRFDEFLDKEIELEIAELRSGSRPDLTNFINSED